MTEPSPELATAQPLEALLFPPDQARIWAAISAVANHEAKCYTLAMLASERESLSRHRIGRLVIDSAEDAGSTWQPYSEGLVGNYIQDSFLPAGLAICERMPERRYKLTHLGRKIGFPLAGLIMAWSLRHPEVSVQRLLSGTQTSGQAAAPQVRAEMYYELLTQPGEIALKANDIKGLDGLSKLDGSTIHRIVRGLDRLKIVRLNQGNATGGGEPITVSIEPELVPAITEMMNIIDAVLRCSPDTLALGNQLAARIVRDKEATHQIMDKAHKFSIGMNRQSTASVKQSLLQILAEGPLTLDEITACYNIDRQEPVTKGRISKVLNSMSEEIQVVGRVKKPRASYKLYGLVTENEQ